MDLQSLKMEFNVTICEYVRIQIFPLHIRRIKQFAAERNDNFYESANISLPSNLSIGKIEFIIEQDFKETLTFYLAMTWTKN